MGGSFGPIFGPRPSPPGSTEVTSATTTILGVTKLDSEWLEFANALKQTAFAMLSTIPQSGPKPELVGPVTRALQDRFIRDADKAINDAVHEVFYGDQPQPRGGPRTIDQEGNDV